MMLPLPPLHLQSDIFWELMRSYYSKPPFSVLTIIAVKHGSKRSGSTSLASSSYRSPPGIESSCVGVTRHGDSQRPALALSQPEYDELICSYNRWGAALDKKKRADAATDELTHKELLDHLYAVTAGQVCVRLAVIGVICSFASLPLLYGDHRRKLHFTLQVDAIMRCCCSPTAGRPDHSHPGHAAGEGEGREPEARAPQ
jgi:hypothetical protein